ncbi:DUF3618 domain-containing protein [Acuticoccus sp. MNP-M23]|uniref:DUF3618 domain-containing protein n=1 Tax=Acuticoccus sp. MNP-M23 TaxID=3072793 RepID=UPI00281515C1|nr:DUF3618 domain-containing protein [Acuticoccus sp. MNP-M23]WMS42068.1 DUF3618 domain-containing protein [Acuticoccus sp. MNP-M23]
MTERSTTQIEREVEAQRYEVEETLDALRNKLSAGQMLDTLSRSFTTAGGQGGEFFNNLGRQVKENPLPIAITGIGLAWLLMGQNQKQTPPALPAPRRTYPPQFTAYDRARYAADETSHGAEYAVNRLRGGYYDVKAEARNSAHAAYDHARYAADEAKHGAEYAVGQMKAGAYAVQDGASNAAGRVYDKARLAADETKHGAKYVGDQMKAGAYAVKDSASSAADAMYDRARIAADEVSHGAAYVSDQLKSGAYAVSDAAHSAYESARDTAYDAADTAGVYGRRAQRTVVDFVKEEPLIAGAVGLALGAALGAIMPATRQEDELIGPYRDRARDEAIDYASAQADKASHVAEESFKAAEAKAHEEGLIPEEGDKTVAEKAEDVVKAAKTKAREEAKS